MITAGCEGIGREGSIRWSSHRIWGGAKKGAGLFLVKRALPRMALSTVIYGIFASAATVA